MFLKVAASFIGKLFGFKNGALFLVSGSLSSGITFYLTALLQNTELKNIVLPIVVYVFGFMIFFLFTLIDLLTGLWAARYLNATSVNPKKTYIKSYKLYRTMWKGLGISVFALMVLMVCLFTEVIDGHYAYYFTLWALVTVWLMASAFEFYSIGENIQKRTGEMPEFFKFVEKITTAAQVGIIIRAKKTFAAGNPENPQQVEHDSTEDENLEILIKPEEDEKPI